jgi:hypothetical protein
MRLLIIVAGLVLVLGGPVVAKELKVTNSADFVNCAAGVALTAGPDAGQVALAGDTCVVQPGAYVGIVTVTLQNLKILANVGATLNGRIIIQANGVQIGAAGQGFTINDNAGPAIQINVGMGATQNITIEGNVVTSTAGPAIQSIGAADLRNLRILGNQLRSTVANGISFMHTGALEDAVIAENTLETNGGAGIGFLNFLNGRVRRLSISDNRINGNAADGVVFVNIEQRGGAGALAQHHSWEHRRSAVRQRRGRQRRCVLRQHDLGQSEFQCALCQRWLRRGRLLRGRRAQHHDGDGRAQGVLIANAGVAERLSSTEACSSSAIMATASGCRTPGDCASCL